MRGYWPQTLRASADICSTEGLGPGMSTDVEMVVVLRLQLHIPSGLQDVQQLNGHDVDALPPQRGVRGGVWSQSRQPPQMEEPPQIKILNFQRFHFP